MLAKVAKRARLATTIIRRWSIGGGLREGEKAAVGFEPTNNGFAIRPLRPLGYTAVVQRVRIAPSRCWGKIGSKQPASGLVQVVFFTCLIHMYSIGYQHIPE